MSEDITLTGYTEGECEQGLTEKGVYGYLPDGREVAIASVVFSDKRFDWHSYIEGGRRVFVTKQEADKLIAGNTP